MPCWYCPVGVQGTILGIVVDLSALPYFLRPFPSPHRVVVPGRLVLLGSDCASRRGAVSRGSAHPRSETWVRVRSGVWLGLLVEEAVRSQKRALLLLSEAFRSERQARVKSGRHFSSARAFGWRLDHPSGLSFRYLGWPKSCALVRNVVCWAKPLQGSRSTRDPGFMNPTGAPERFG